MLQSEVLHRGSGPSVGVVLPTPIEVPYLRDAQELKYEVHMLPAAAFNIFDPFSFDAAHAALEVAKYAAEEGLQGLTSMNCLPSLVAAAALQELASKGRVMRGPAFDSVAICCHKLLLRKLVPSKKISVFDPREVNQFGANRLAHLRAALPPFPLALKFADTQYYIGTHRLNTFKDLEEFMSSESHTPNRYVRWVLLDQHSAPGIRSHATTCCRTTCFPAREASLGVEDEIVICCPEEFRCFEKRQEFYFANLSAGLKRQLGFAGPSDISLFHFETWLPSDVAKEYQLEVVVSEKGQAWVHDSGDIVRDPATDLLVLYKTPFSLGGDTPMLQQFLKTVVGTLMEHGWEFGPMDIEFKASADGSTLELVEINSRYSYMGWHQYGLDKEHGKGHVTSRISAKQLASYNEDFAEHVDAKGGHKHFSSMRNITNRIELSLGKMPSVLPSRDHAGISVLASFFYSTQHGDIAKFFSVDAVKKHTNQYAPKPTASPGRVQPEDCVQYNGWCKLGFFTDVIEDDVDFINAHLKTVYQEAFAAGDAAYVMPVVPSCSQQLPLTYLQ